MTRDRTGGASYIPYVQIIICWLCWVYTIGLVVIDPASIRRRMKLACEVEIFQVDFLQAVNAPSVPRLMRRMFLLWIFGDKLDKSVDGRYLVFRKFLVSVLGCPFCINLQIHKHNGFVSWGQCVFSSRHVCLSLMCSLVSTLLEENLSKMWSRFLWENLLRSWIELEFPCPDSS